MSVEVDIRFMRRCLELADNGLGAVAPNPLVGSVVVYNNRIIGEGYHQKYGELHAEAAAIAAVKDKSLLSQSTLYVSLEPCSHQGKQPPCSDLIIRYGIPRVVVATQDPFHMVNGSGIERLRQAGVDVQVGVLEQEAQEQNRRFFTYHSLNRPYIILKWAQSLDGFIDKEREADTPPEWLTGSTGRALVHRWRSEEQAIMVGANTVIRDNPHLTVRCWTGKNPIRLIVDRDLSLPSTSAIFDNSASTLLFTYASHAAAAHYSPTVNLSPLLEGQDAGEQLFTELRERKIQSVLVEGGLHLFERLIENGLWDEARVFTANKEFGGGIKAPVIHGRRIGETRFPNFRLEVYRKN